MFTKIQDDYGTIEESTKTDITVVVCGQETLVPASTTGVKILYPKVSTSPDIMDLATI